MTAMRCQNKRPIQMVTMEEELPDAPMLRATFGTSFLCNSLIVVR